MNTRCFRKSRSHEENTSPGAHASRLPGTRVLQRSSCDKFRHFLHVECRNKLGHRQVERDRPRNADLSSGDPTVWAQDSVKRKHGVKHGETQTDPMVTASTVENTITIKTPRATVEGAVAHHHHHQIITTVVVTANNIKNFRPAAY